MNNDDIIRKVYLVEYIDGTRKNILMTVSMMRVEKHKSRWNYDPHFTFTCHLIFQEVDDSYEEVASGRRSEHIFRTYNKDNFFMGCEWLHGGILSSSGTCPYTFELPNGKLTLLLLKQSVQRLFSSMA